MSTFSERLADLMRGAVDEKRPNTAFARLVGLSEGAIRSYLNGTLPRVDVLVQIAKATNTSITWLATGEGQRDSATESSHVQGTQGERVEYPMLQVVDPQMIEAGSLVMIPRMDVEAAAGDGRVAHSEHPVGFVAFQEAYLRDLGINPRFAQIIQVNGRSMYPTLDDREFVVIDTSIDRVVDEAIYAVVYGGLVLIKRIRLDFDGTVTLTSDNREGNYPDKVVKPSDLDGLHIVGRLKGHFRML